MPLLPGIEAREEATTGVHVETPAADSTPEAQFEQLIAAFREARPKDDVTPIRNAWEFASRYHAGQVRVSGEPYMSHPLAVARILAGMRMDVVSVETGLLHDVVEDTSVTVADIRKNFGEEVARCVDGVTKLSKIDFFSAEDRQAENYRKMLLAMVEGYPRHHRQAGRPAAQHAYARLSQSERRERIARETLEIYAPIAHRLGMGKVRGELEDLAFHYLDPEAYAEISQTIETQRAANEEYLERMRRTVEAELRREGIPARVEARVKRAFSVYQKLKRQKITLDQVYDSWPSASSPTR